MVSFTVLLLVRLLLPILAVLYFRYFAFTVTFCVGMVNCPLVIRFAGVVSHPSK